MADSPPKVGKFTPDMFVALEGDQEINSLLKDIAYRKDEFIARGAQGNLHQFVPESYDGSSLFCQCKRPPSDLGIMSAQVSNKGELYFMKLKAQPAGEGLWKLQTVGDVFKLQRRQSYRIRVPKDQNAYFIMTHPFLIKWRLDDISAGGLRVIDAGRGGTWPIRVADKGEGQLHLGENHHLISVKFKVSRVQSKDSKMILGLEFLEPDQKLEMRILSYVMELYRLFYLRPPDRSSTGT